MICPCPDGCNGCERLELKELRDFLVKQSNLWTGRTQKDADVVRAYNRLINGLWETSFKYLK